MTDYPNSLEELMDLNGADFNQWPDEELAQKARAEALRDPEFRQKLDAAKRVESALRKLPPAMGASSRFNDRIAGMETAILARIEPRQNDRWLFSAPMLSRLAASILIAGVLGVGVQEWIPLQLSAPTEAYDQLLLGTSDQTQETGTIRGEKP